MIYLICGSAGLLFMMFLAIGLNCDRNWKYAAQSIGFILVIIGFLILTVYGLSVTSS